MILKMYSRAAVLFLLASVSWSLNAIAQTDDSSDSEAGGSEEKSAEKFTATIGNGIISDSYSVTGTNGSASFTRSFGRSLSVDLGFRPSESLFRYRLEFLNTSTGFGVPSGITPSTAMFVRYAGALGVQAFPWASSSGLLKQFSMGVGYFVWARFATPTASINIANNLAMGGADLSVGWPIPITAALGITSSAKIQLPHFLIESGNKSGYFGSAFSLEAQVLASYRILSWFSAMSGFWFRMESVRFSGTGERSLASPVEQSIVLGVPIILKVNF